jgi:two-component system, LytTR family, response regulator LytT
MLIVAVCDDSQGDRLQIRDYIKDYCIQEDLDMNIIIFENGEALEKHYINNEPAFDIIFLDIYMSGKNGIEVAKQIRKYDSTCKIIFTTSSSEYALESFEVFPFNYLVKPISSNEFNAVFEKAIEIHNNERQYSLIIKIGAAIHTVYYKDILFIESDAKLLNIHTVSNKNFKFLSKLDDIQNNINDRRFLRCHKSFLLNMDYALSIEDYSFRLIDNTRISVTQRNFATIKKTFFDYILDKSNLNKDKNRR